MVYTMKQLPQIIGTSSSTCIPCLHTMLKLAPNYFPQTFLHLRLRWNNVEPTPTIKKSQWRISNLEILVKRDQLSPQPTPDVELFYPI